MSKYYTCELKVKVTFPKGGYIDSLSIGHNENRFAECLLDEVYNRYGEVSIESCEVLSEPEEVE